MRAADSRAIGRPTAVAAVVALAAAGVTACGGDDASDLPFLGDVPETVALGEFPEPPTDDPSATVPTPTIVGEATTTTTTEPPVDPVEPPIADDVSGNRVLVIGDTVFQSTSPRAGGVMCDALTAFGWQAEIAAEVGRFVDFGREVVDARVVPEEPEWDAAIVMFGNHFNGDFAAYRAELTALVESLSPRPVIVYTLVEDDNYQAELNSIIRSLPETYPNVVIVDWAEIAAADADVILADTPSGLSDEGRSRVGVFAVASLGEAPVGAEPGCLPPFFTDDSAIVL